MNSNNKKQQLVTLFLPYNAPGHINPSLAIADFLKSEYGHRTIFCIIGELAGDKIASRGHELIGLPNLDNYLENKSNGERADNKDCDVIRMASIFDSTHDSFQHGPEGAFKALMDLCRREFALNVTRNLSRYDDVIRDVNPDLVVIDLQFPPPYLLTEEGRSKHAWVRIQSSNPLALLKSKLPNKVRPSTCFGHSLLTREERIKLRQDEPEKWLAMLKEWQDCRDKYLQPMHDCYSCILDKYTSLRQHLADSDVILRCDSPQLNVYFFPKALDYDQDDDLFEYAPNYMHCNSLIRSLDISQAEQIYWLGLIKEKSRNKKAIILYTLGSIASSIIRVNQRIVDMLAQDKDRLYIVSKGQLGDQLKLNEDNMIGANWIPQPFLLQHVDMAIVHGGNNGVTECMHYGVPLIVLPCFFDQFDNAQRVDSLKLGKRLDIYKCTQDELISAIDDILSNDSLRKRVKQIGEEMQAQNDVKRVCEAFNELASERSVSLESRNKFNVTE